MYKAIQKIIYNFIWIAIWLACPMVTKAATIDFNQKVVQLQSKFPDGKYWNHVGMAVDNSDGVTSSPCTLHRAEGVSHVYGTGGCTCNHFADKGHLSATQCMGFANKLGHDVFGDTTWTMYNAPTAVQVANIRVGDIVRIDGYHSVFVIGRNGSNITVAEANYPNGCQIKWGRIINLATVTVSYFEHATNYDVVLGTGMVTPVTPSTQAPTTQTPTTQTASTQIPAVEKPTTEHATTEQPKNEETTKPATEVSKGKWVTSSKKKYYLDENGQKVTGLCVIGSQTYYFNSEGVLQKNKWITVDGETYYLGTDGSTWKKQWLYYNNVLVYVKADGKMAKGEIVKISGKQYYFNSKGKRSKGFKKFEGTYYYCNSKGVIQRKKWITKGGKKYYLQKDGVRAESVLLKIGKYKYYFNEKGQMQKNKQVTYNQKIYKANKKGHCKFVRDIVEELPEGEGV